MQNDESKNAWEMKKWMLEKIKMHEEKIILPPGGVNQQYGGAESENEWNWASKE